MKSRQWQSSLAGLILFWIAVAGSPQTAHPQITVPGFFGDHMVLQQNAPIRIWGWAEPGEVIQVELAGQTATAVADAQRKWSAEIPAMEANAKSQTLKIGGNQSSNLIELTDVLIGEVWLCSGQSNMEWSVRQCANAEQEIANGDHPTIRHFKVPRNPSPTPVNDIQAEWEVCSPDTVGAFTATGYYTAVQLQKELNVPIGLINSSWGGTRIEPWTCLEGLGQIDALSELYDDTLMRTPGSDPFNTRMEQHLQATRDWTALAESRLQSGESIDPHAAFPTELQPLNGSREPTALYNGMIHPLVGLTIRGVLWYQGESNRNEGMTYFEKKKALIQGWRDIWGQGEFPFYIVQIAPFQYGQDDPEILAEFWEAQAATLTLPNTGMVVTNDIATLNDIHPPNKQDVGLRLSLMALKDVYGKTDLVAHSPRLQKMEILDGHIRLTFLNTGGGLKTRDGKAPSHFELIDANSEGFQPAAARIDGDTVILSCDQVKAPVAFRFAWHKLAEPNLTGGTGLPVGAVRGGKVPTFFNQIPGSEAYDLVYELDLKRLGQRFDYDVDHSSAAGSFDRVGYLLELESEKYGSQKLFVSMNAFTDDPSRTAIPVASTQFSFQGPVEALEIHSTDRDLAALSGMRDGIAEFWPNNYGPENATKVTGASDSEFDFGDQISGPRNGYGSMQIHDAETGQTLFAINHWKEGDDADIGIGNCDGQHKDWTFSKSAKEYSTRKLSVFVRKKSN